MKKRKIEKLAEQILCLHNEDRDDIILSIFKKINETDPEERDILLFAIFCEDNLPSLYYLKSGLESIIKRKEKDKNRNQN